MRTPIAISPGTFSTIQLYAVNLILKAIRHAKLKHNVIPILPLPAVATLIANQHLTFKLISPTAVRTNGTHLRHKRNAEVLIPAIPTTASKTPIALRALPT